MLTTATRPTLRYHCAASIGRIFIRRFNYFAAGRLARPPLLYSNRRRRPGGLLFSTYYVYVVQIGRPAIGFTLCLNKYLINPIRQILFQFLFVVRRLIRIIQAQAEPVNTVYNNNCGIRQKAFERRLGGREGGVSAAAAVTVIARSGNNARNLAAYRILPDLVGEFNY